MRLLLCNVLRVLDGDASLKHLTSVGQSERKHVPLILSVTGSERVTPVGHQHHQQDTYCSFSYNGGLD